MKSVDWKPDLWTANQAIPKASGLPYIQIGAYERGGDFALALKIGIQEAAKQQRDEKNFECALKIGIEEVERQQQVASDAEMARELQGSDDRFIRQAPGPIPLVTGQRVVYQPQGLLNGFQQVTSQKGRQFLNPEGKPLTVKQRLALSNAAQSEAARASNGGR